MNPQLLFAALQRLRSQGGGGSSLPPDFFQKLLAMLGGGGDSSFGGGGGNRGLPPWLQRVAPYKPPQQFMTRFMAQPHGDVGGIAGTLIGKLPMGLSGGQLPSTGGGPWESLGGLATGPTDSYNGVGAGGYRPRR